jgi:hypothetical protein
MMAGRILAYLFLALALMAAGAEAVRSLEAGVWQPMALGWLWFTIDVGSLNLAQAVIQRYLHPSIWDPGIAWILQQPAWSVFAAIALILHLVFRLRRRRRWFSRR